MATVHVARRDGSDQALVLKQLHEQLAENEETSRRFQREANIASALDHSGIAKVKYAGVEDGIFCIALECIAGRTVEQMSKAAKARGGTLPFEVSVQVILQALEALAYAHEFIGPDGRSLGLVHRDLSPRNVMVGFDGVVKIIDFGIAKGRVDDHRTALGVLMGTPYYMSPEQARAVEIDHRSDIYTLGVVLFEMLTGRRLVQAKGRANILVSVVREPAPNLLDRNPHAPPELAPVLQRALGKKPETRFPSARAFHQALSQAFADAVARTAREGGTRLHHVAPDQLGRFLQEIAPEALQKARTLDAEVQRLGADAMGNGAVHEATRLAPMPVPPSDLSEVEQHTPTRAAHPEDEPVLLPTMLGLPMDGGGFTYQTAAPSQPSVSASPGLRPSSRRWQWPAVAALALAATALAWQLRPRRTAIEPLVTRPAPRPPSPSAAPAELSPTVVAAAVPSSRTPTPQLPAPTPSRRGSPSPARVPAPVRSASPRPPATKPEPGPAEASSTSATAQAKRGLRRAVGQLRARPEIAAALALADRIEDVAKAHLDDRARDRVQAEVESALRNSNVDDMIEGLDRAIRTLSRHLD